MMKDCVVRSRIDPNIKAEAAELFGQMGMTLSDAIRLFVYQAVAQQSIPFQINLPNAATKKALKSIQHKKGLGKTSLKQLAKDWNAACAK